MTTKAAYLEHYLDSLESLPAELMRNFNLLKDLDVRTFAEVREVDKMAVEFLSNIQTMTEEQKADKTSQIRKRFKKSLDYGDDKVQLAMQTYEMVDKHIRRLDADLARFEADLKDKALNPIVNESDSTTHKKKGRKSAADKEKKKRRGPSDDDEIPKSVRKKLKQQLIVQPEIAALPAALTITHPSDVLDMPVDPNEPTYCFCHQVSYGEMIGCDNPDCPIEWFHFACVGLTSKPKGKWYCSNCSSERKKK